MTTPKWTDERTTDLNNAVAGQTPVTRDHVAKLAEQFQVTPRSISAKLRKMGVEVETASAAPKAFSDDEASALSDFVTDNSGTYTYAEVAANFADAKFSAKQIQGKVLSLELTSHIRPTPKAETVKSYSDAEEAKIVELIKSGSYVEDIAAALGREVPSIRGKALSLLREGRIEAMPVQEVSNAKAREDVLEGLNIADMTVAEIAEATGKSERGVKSMLSRRGISAKDHDGVAKRAKLDAKSAK